MCHPAGPYQEGDQKSDQLQGHPGLLRKGWGRGGREKGHSQAEKLEPAALLTPTWP